MFRKTNSSKVPTSYSHFSLDADETLKAICFNFKRISDASTKPPIKQTPQRGDNEKIDVPGFFYRHLQWVGPSFVSAKGSCSVTRMRSTGKSTKGLKV